jgi:hypothetical protein
MLTPPVAVVVRPRLLSTIESRNTRSYASVHALTYPTALRVAKNYTKGYSDTQVRTTTHDSSRS